MLNFQTVPSRAGASCGVDAAAAVDNVVAVGGCNHAGLAAAGGGRAPIK